MGCAFSWHILSRTVRSRRLCRRTGSIHEAGTKRGRFLDFARGMRRCRLALRMLHPPPALPHQLQPTAARQQTELGGEVKKQNKKVFFDKILDNCIWFLHGIEFLLDFLWRCHLRQRAGQEVTSSCVLSCPMDAQGVHRSREALGRSEGAIKPSWGYREFLWEVWESGPPCLALLCPLLAPTLLLSVHLKAVGF